MAKKKKAAKSESNLATGSAENTASALKDRIIDFKRLDSSEIDDHPMNWRSHPNQQIAAMKGVLKQIGKAGAVLCYYSERNEGRLTSIDGHMRKNEFSGEWPCLITDLNDDEADLLVQSFDPVGLMAHNDRLKLEELRKQQEFEDASVRIMLDGIDSWQPQDKQQQEKNQPGGIAQQDGDEEETLPEMELAPYEHYDYILVLATNTWDWNWLCNRLGIEKVQASTDPRHHKIGLGRAINADKLIAVLREADSIIEKQAGS